MRLGISVDVYKALESSPVCYIPKEPADKLVRFYGISAAEFLDRYSRLLYDGKAKRIRALREEMG